MKAVENFRNEVSENGRETEREKKNQNEQAELGINE